VQDFTNKIEKVVSKERLSGYTTYYAKSFGCSPLSLYRWNTLLSESLYPSLQVVEISLRNVLHQAIAEHFKNEAWFKQPNILLPKEMEKVLKAEYDLKKMKQPTTTGKVIAELTFGFWTSLMDARYEMKLWRSKIIKRAFPHMPTSIRMRHHISKQFDQIRKMRNRVFHHEPIWHWKDLKDQHEQIRVAITWIEPEALSLSLPDRFLAIYENGPKSLEEKNV